MNRWDTFNQITKGNPPRELYLEALKHVDAKNSTVTALDIAAGALNETRDMLNLGFDVTAIDANPSLSSTAQVIDSPNLKVKVSKMEDYAYEETRFDLIIAMFALPFIGRKNFDKTFDKIVASLSPQGVFAFHLFGNNDDWNQKESIVFHDRKHVSRLVKDLKILKLKETEYDGFAANGQPKHWHLFQLIVTQV